MSRTAASVFLVLAACAPAEPQPAPALSSTSAPEGGRSTEATPREAPAPQTQRFVVRPPRLPNPDLAFAVAGYGPGKGDPVPAEVREAFDRSSMGGIPDLPALASTAGGSSTWAGTSSVQVTGTPIPQLPGLYELTLTNTGTGWVERFFVRIPSNTAPASTPVLVVFHKFGSSHWDFYNNTSFYAEASARDWLLVAPFSASTKHFGCDPAQDNTQFVIDFVLQYFPQADPSRIYGVGFSMGGSSLMSYAARHLAPGRGMFAALVNHSGGGALWHTYGHEWDDDDADDNYETGQNLEVPDILEFWYGGAPTIVPFAYQSHSVLDLDPLGTLGDGTHMLTNLMHVPVLFWRAQNDPIIYIRDQHQAVFNVFVNSGGQGEMVTAPGNAHTWITLDETAVCDWLAPHSLQQPTQGRTLASQDGRFFDFDVVRDQPDDFGTFEWTVDAGINTVVVTATENVASLTIDVDATGLSPLFDIHLATASGDGSPDTIRVRGLPYQPVQLLRDGQPAPGWIYDAGTQTLSFTDFDPAATAWTIRL